MIDRIKLRAVAAAAAMTIAGASLASSHREAPFITNLPKVDASDFYMFNSYEAGRTGFVTVIANYLPLQEPYGGPNYFQLDPAALYEIHIDNNGDGAEDSTYQFRFTKTTQGLAVMAGGKSIPVPLANIGPESIADYATYAGTFSHAITIPGCSTPGKVFVGQRKDPFVVNLGETFDLVNIKYPVEELAPGGNGRSLNANTIDYLNVTSLALEIPTACLTSGSETVIGGWTTASIRQAAIQNPVPQSDKSVASVGAVTKPTGADLRGGPWVQVSRLGAPLVNELVIGLPDKDRFNASRPKDDAQFADYVTNPSLPILLQVLFGSAGVTAPNVYPRSDLVAAFLTGVSGLNQPANVKAAEQLRLNTATAV